VCVGGDALPEFFVRASHIRVITVDVLAREAEELVVVGSLEPVPAGAVDSPHRLLLSSLYALTVVPRAPKRCALRRVSSNVERA
jgi:hypothetical protein